MTGGMCSLEVLSESKIIDQASTSDKSQENVYISGLTSSRPLRFGVS